ncbi:MAG: hypothetical protein ACLT9V_01630 [Anaerococcus obesiensis]
MKLLEKLGFKDKNKNNIKQSIESGNEDYLLVYPKSVEDEVNRTISSLGFIDKDIPENKSLEEIKKNTKKINKLKKINENLEKIKNDNIDELKNLPKTIDFYKKSSKIKDKMLKGRKYFYLSGWVPESKLQVVKDSVEKYEDSLVDQKKNSQTIANPPTKLKNNQLTRPFEFLNIWSTKLQ